MGCGCNKAQPASVANTGRSTIYQVVGPDQSVVDEFTSLPEARTLAVSISGRVRVTSKPVV